MNIDVYAYMHVRTIYEAKNINFKESKEGKREEGDRKSDVITL